MTSTQVITQMKAGKVWPLYLIYGEESYLAHQLEKDIIERLLPEEERETNLYIFDTDPDYTELENLIFSSPFFGSKNVIVIKESKLCKSKKEDEKDKHDKADSFVDLFDNIPEFSHLILVCIGKADKRKKIYKKIEKNGAVIEVGVMKIRDVRDWLHLQLVKANRKMDMEAQEYFLTVLSLMPQISLGFVQNELEKMFLYIDPNTSITKIQLQEIMAVLPEVSIFAIIEMVSQKQTAKALLLLQEQVASGQPLLQIIALIARQVRLLWQAKELADSMNSVEISRKLGVPGFVSDRLIRQSQYFTIQTLKETLIALAKANRDFKVGSGILLEDIIIQLCR